MKKKSFWGCFWGHKWSNWVGFNKPMMLISTGQQYFQRAQRRHCERCGYTQEEEIL